MKKDLTELVFILDRSGSMHGTESDTIGGFNSVLEANRQLPGEAHVTTVLFSQEVKLLHDRLPIQAVRPMTANDYRTYGGTALLDAVGDAITKIVNVQRSLPEEYRADKVQFVIITDGYENASRRYSLAEVRSMIAREREQYGWDFLFLGANIDAVQVAETLNISRDRAANVVNDAVGMNVQYAAVARATCGFRMNPCAVSDEWKQEIDADLERRKE